MLPLNRRICLLTTKSRVQTHLQKFLVTVGALLRVFLATVPHWQGLTQFGDTQTNACKPSPFAMGSSPPQEARKRTTFSDKRNQPKCEYVDRNPPSETVKKYVFLVH